MLPAARQLANWVAGLEWDAVPADQHKLTDMRVLDTLGLALAGPRRYGDVVIDDAWMGDGRREATADDIRRALWLYRRAGIALAVLVAGLLAL